MYVIETIWFKKQQRKRTWYKGVKYLCMCLGLVLFVFLGIWSVPLNHKFLDWQKENSNIPEQVLAYEKTEVEGEEQELCSCRREGD